MVGVQVLGQIDSVVIITLGLEKSLGKMFSTSFMLKGIGGKLFSFPFVFLRCDGSYD